MVVNASRIASHSAANYVSRMLSCLSFTTGTWFSTAEGEGCCLKGKRTRFLNVIREILSKDGVAPRTDRTLWLFLLSYYLTARFSRVAERSGATSAETTGSLTLASA
jgi:hypothetical protein